MSDLWLAVAITIFGGGAGDIRTVPIGIYSYEDCRSAISHVSLEDDVVDRSSGRMVVSRHLDCIELPGDLLGRAAIGAVEEGALDGEVEMPPRLRGNSPC